jgi:uncharacterized damage-inducible protein DinB
MRPTSIYFLCLLLIGLGGTAVSNAQDKPAVRPQSDSAVPNTGARAEFLGEIAFYEQRYVRLAEAVPAEKYSWRPGEGVRSIGEVYTHIVAANYGVARALGTAPPPGFDFKSVASISSDKAKTVQALKDSFVHFRGAILALSDADLDKPQKMFGQQTTLRGAFFMITGHFGEHLGQSIAYARMNSVVPPWTEEANKQEQKQSEKPNH